MTKAWYLKSPYDTATYIDPWVWSLVSPTLPWRLRDSTVDSPPSPTPTHHTVTYIIPRGLVLGVPHTAIKTERLPPSPPYNCLHHPLGPGPWCPPHWEACPPPPPPHPNTVTYIIPWGRVLGVPHTAMTTERLAGWALLGLPHVLPGLSHWCILGRRGGPPFYQPLHVVPEGLGLLQHLRPRGLLCKISNLKFKQANSKNCGPPPGNIFRPWSRSKVKVTAWYQ